MREICVLQVHKCQHLTYLPDVCQNFTTTWTLIKNQVLYTKSNFKNAL